MENEKRKLRGYKVKDATYNKAMKRANKEKTPLATLIEVWITSYANRLPFLIDTDAIHLNNLFNEQKR